MLALVSGTSSRLFLRKSRFNNCLWEMEPSSWSCLKDMCLPSRLIHLYLLSFPFWLKKNTPEPPFHVHKYMVKNTSLHINLQGDVKGISFLVLIRVIKFYPPPFLAQNLFESTTFINFHEKHHNVTDSNSQSCYKLTDGDCFQLDCQVFGNKTQYST